MKLHRAFSVGIVAALFVACAPTPLPSALPAEPAAPPAEPAPTAASGATGSLTCPEGGKPATAAYDKSCKADSDCAWAPQPACCGAVHALGVHQGEEKKISGACAECRPRACAIGPVVADDGGRSKDYPGGQDVAVACVKETCTTRIKN